MTLAWLFGTVTSSPLAVRIWVDRSVSRTTVPMTWSLTPSKETKSPTPYWCSEMMKKPERKSPMTVCAPKPMAAETTVAGTAAPTVETPRLVSTV